MATLCNKKVSRTRTISNATGYSMYTWKPSPTEAPTSVAAPCHACQSSSMTICFSSQIKTLLWWFCQICHRYARVTGLLWQTGFCHKFIIKLKLWRIWLLQWWNLFMNIPRKQHLSRMISKAGHLKLWKHAVWLGLTFRAWNWSELHETSFQYEGNWWHHEAIAYKQVPRTRWI